MKILMVGLGGAGQRHWRVLRELLGRDARFLAWRVRGRNQVLKPDFTVDPSASFDLPTVPSLEDGLAEGPEIVVIANPTSEHLNAAIPAARAGAHLLIEKPLAHSRKGIEELQRTLGARGRIGMVGYMMRFHPCLRRIHEWLTEGRLGKLLSARFEVSSYVPEWHPYEDFRQLYAVRRELGGGVVLTESHELDLAYWFFGQPRRVFAMGGSLSGLCRDVEDTVGITLDYGFPVHLQMSFMQKPPNRSCRINGTLGAIAWDGDESVRLFDGSWKSETFDGFDRVQMFYSQDRQFLAAVEGKELPAVDIASGAASLEIALSALDSLRSGSPVEVH